MIKRYSDQIVDLLFARNWRLCLALTLILLLAMSGCAKKIPHSLVPEFQQRNIKTIAVLPVADVAKNPEVSGLLRERLVEALYFKGYPKIFLTVIDEKLKAFYRDVKAPTTANLPPRDVGGLLGVDAVMYSTLTDCRTSSFYLYAQTSTAVSFEIYSTRTGELLWSARHQVGERNFDVTPDRLKLKACQVFEPALQEIVDKAMDTLPDGPGT